MKWYLINDVNDCRENIIEYLNSFGDMCAFVPRMMKFFKWKGQQQIVPQDWDPGYIIVKTDLKYDEVFSRYWKLIQENSFQFRPNEDVIKFRKDEQKILAQLFDEDMISCSVGNIVDGKLIVDKGPLKGLESFVSKVDRHKRLAYIKVNDELKVLKVYLEVLNKS